MIDWTTEENLEMLEFWAIERKWLGQQVRSALPQLTTIVRKEKKLRPALLIMLQEHQTMADTLTRCQERGTELLMENRQLKAELRKLKSESPRKRQRGRRA